MVGASPPTTLDLVFPPLPAFTNPRTQTGGSIKPGETSTNSSVPPKGLGLNEAHVGPFQQNLGDGFSLVVSWLDWQLGSAVLDTWCGLPTQKGAAAANPNYIPPSQATDSSHKSIHNTSASPFQGAETGSQSNLAWEWPNQDEAIKEAAAPINGLDCP